MRPRDDIRNDVRCGFDLITARAIDKIGADGIIDQIKKRVGDSHVYISVDIDVLDPAYAPGKIEGALEIALARTLTDIGFSSHRDSRTWRLDQP